MPTLKDLRRELRRLRVSTDDIQLSGQIYDDLLNQAEIIIDEDETLDDEED